jgi:hypothetical protein
MANEKKHYARYIYVRGHQTLWRGDPANAGALFRSVAIVTDQFNSTIGIFQVYALEGTGKGIENGKFAGSDGEPRLLFDKDFNGMDAAARQFDEIVNQAVAEGFKIMSMWDQIEFEEALRASKK